jgi:hypothetical protein
MTYEAPSAQPDQPHECYSDQSEGTAPRPETALNDAGSIWTDTLQARLRQLWAQGLTASQIAAELSITRNACEPYRVYRRPFSLSHAAMACSCSMA